MGMYTISPQLSSFWFLRRSLQIFRDFSGVRSAHEREWNENTYNSRHCLPKKKSWKVKGLLVVFLPGGSAQLLPFNCEGGVTGKPLKVSGGLGGKGLKWPWDCLDSGWGPVVILGYMVRSRYHVSSDPCGHGHHSLNTGEHPTCWAHSIGQHSSNRDLLNIQNEMLEKEREATLSQKSWFAIRIISIKI